MFDHIRGVKRKKVRTVLKSESGNKLCMTRLPRVEKESEHFRIREGEYR